MKAQFAPALISKYNVNGARYTSYPTANVFHPTDADAYIGELKKVPEGRALSLYVHVPFCATICYYCACNKINTGNHKHADAYLDRLTREMQLQAEYLPGANPVEQLHFGGGTPTFLNAAQFERVFAALRDHFELSDGSGRDYSIEIDPRGIDPARIEHLAGLGLNRMSIGVQDFDPAVQAAVNRIQSEEETAAVVEAARANGFESINMDLIYGLPLQTREGFMRTIDQVLRLDPDRISLYNYAHLPERFKTQRQIRARDIPDAELKLALMGTAIERFGDAGFELVGMDHFAKASDALLNARKTGSLHRNFQGYTTHGHCELVALGVSAISRVGRAYAQNAKTLEAYYQAIDTGQLAIDRGYFLTENDLITADVIQRLMCRFELDVAAFNAHHGVDFWTCFERTWAQLEAMAAEGLLTIDRHHLRITPTGRFLIRNICMVFDAYASPVTDGFSKTL